MIYATDLDRTIIFSNKFLNECNEEIICVEKHNEKEISYITKNAFEKFNTLKTFSNLKIIPVTTRSVKQFKRIDLVNSCEFAITTNGGTILHNGEIFKPWEKYINKLLENYKEDFDKIKNYLLKFKEDFSQMPLLVDNIFIYTKLLDNKKNIQNILNKLDIELDKEKWTFTLQGLKLYIIPKGISKEAALLYLKQYLKENNLVVSGDGKLDYGFLKVGNKTIIPEKSEILNYIVDKNFEYELIPAGLSGTSILFDKIKEILEKENGSF